MAESFRKGDKVERIEKKLDNPVAALRRIGILMVAESQRAFKDQQFGSKRWDARKVPNVFGIIADFHAGRRAPPARRFEGRPALRDTGRLASSIAFQVVGNVVEVGTNLDYAAAHHLGGKVQSKPITTEVQTRLWSWLRGQSRELKRRLGFLLNKKYRGQRLQGTVPARPFVGITLKTREMVRQLIGVEIMEAQ